MRRGLAAADRITVSTPALRARIAEETTTPIECLPNTVDPVLFEVPASQRAAGDQLRVGWAGSPTHDVDWRDAATGVRKGLARARAHLVMMGADYRSLLGVKDASFVPWARAMDEYYLQLTTWHVALAPLIDDPFNRSKSPIKALEAGALGLPIVASHAGPYPDLVVDGETGFLCRSNTDWERALRILAFDEDARFEMGAKARQHVRSLNTAEWAPRWIESFARARDERLAAV
jgi:glycosyltransferase involved in cell wall biosynthesis